MRLYTGIHQIVGLRKILNLRTNSPRHRMFHSFIQKPNFYLLKNRPAPQKYLSEGKIVPLGELDQALDP